MQGNSVWLRIKLALVLILGMNSVQAITPYVGVEYQYQHITGNRDWAQIMPTSFNNAAVFAGAKLHKNFGLEANYYQGLQQSTGVANIQSFDGLNANAAANVSASIKLNGVSVVGNIYVPLDPNFDFMFIVGLVAVRPEVTITGTGSNLATALSQVTGKTQTMARLGVGAEYAEKNWGARTRVLWDDTSRLRLNVTNAASRFNTITSKAFKSAIIVTVGLFYKF